MTSSGAPEGYCKICDEYSQNISIKSGYCLSCKSKHYDTLPEIDQQNLRKQFKKRKKILKKFNSKISNQKIISPEFAKIVDKYKYNWNII